MAAVSLFNLVPRFCLSSASFGRKILVASGHVTTQNLGGKNIRWAGGVAECLLVAVSNSVGFKSSNYPPYHRSSKSNFVDEERYIISAVYKI